MSASVITGEKDYSHAVITAFIGAVVWALTAWIPLLGPLIALIAWIAVIRWRYEGGWGTAILIGLIAWVAALVILFILNDLLNLGVGAFGIPGA